MAYLEEARRGHIFYVNQHDCDLYKSSVNGFISEDLTVNISVLQDDIH